MKRDGSVHPCPAPSRTIQRHAAGRRQHPMRHGSFAGTGRCSRVSLRPPDSHQFRIQHREGHRGPWLSQPGRRARSGERRLHLAWPWPPLGGLGGEGSVPSSWMAIRWPKKEASKVFDWRSADARDGRPRACGQPPPAIGSILHRKSSPFLVSVVTSSKR